MPSPEAELTIMLRAGGCSTACPEGAEGGRAAPLDRRTLLEALVPASRQSSLLVGKAALPARRSVTVVSFKESNSLCLWFPTN